MVDPKSEKPTNLKVEFELNEKQAQALKNLGALNDSNGKIISLNQAAKNIFLEFIVRAASQLLAQQLKD